MDPDVSADDSFYEMTYSDTSNREVYAERLVKDKANFTLFMDKVCVCVCMHVFVRLSMQVMTIFLLHTGNYNLFVYNYNNFLSC